MSYATLEDLQNRLDDDVLIDLTDDSDSATINTAIVTAALEAADLEIDVYLGERYTLPLTETPAILVNLGGTVAIYNLYCRRDGPPDHWQKQYDNAILMLERIRDGQITLGSGSPSEDNSDIAEVEEGERVFTRDTLKNF